MGGRLDSTNAVRPVVCVLTSISFDHTRQLGNTLGAIAYEKAGIIKRGRPVVSGVRGAEARAVIRRVAGPRHAHLRELDTDYEFTYDPPISPIERAEAGRVSVRTWRTSWGALPLPLLGPHQAQNAATALATLDAWADAGLPTVGPGAVARGFANLRLPAHVEVLGQAPWLVIDGAHNVASAQALADTLRLCLPDVPRTLIFGTTRDKDLAGQLAVLLPLFTTCVATRYVENPRTVPIEEVAEAVHKLSGREAILASEPAEALAEAHGARPSAA